MTRGSMFARAAYSAAVYPAGPPPITMTSRTFSLTPASLHRLPAWIEISYMQTCRARPVFLLSSRPQREVTRTRVLASCGVEHAVVLDLVRAGAWQAARRDAGHSGNQLGRLRRACRVLDRVE